MERDAGNRKTELLNLHTFYMKEMQDIVQELHLEFGEDVYTVIERAKTKNLQREWRQIASTIEDNSIEIFVKTLWEPLREKGFQYTVLHKDEGIEINCTQCPIASIAKTIGAEKLFFHHACQQDSHIAKAFNPAITLQRTKTIMQGDNCCNHFYSYADIKSPNR